MDSLGAEVSAKIRSAIKAKLIELGAYVDDELPDYIMVMVANKKTKEQMEDDLNLFLSGNTTVFVNWLHQVLDKLQKVTLGDGGKKKKSKKKAVAGTGIKKKIKEKKEDKIKKPKVKSEKKKKSPVKKGKAGILKKPENTLDEPYDPVEEIHRVRRSSLDHQPVRKSLSKSRSRSPMMKKRPSISPPPRRLNVIKRAGSFDRKRTGEGRPERSRGRSRESPEGGRVHRRRSSSGRAGGKDRRGGANISSKIGAVVSHDSDGEYDPEQMLKKSLASQVKITPRPDRPNQASKSLVLKAVAEADRSIRKKKREERKRDEELDEIHKKRLQLTKARKEGRLDWEVMEEINKKRRSEEPRRQSEEPRRKSVEPRRRSEEELRRRRYDDPRDVDVRDDPRDVDVRERPRERTFSERSSRKRQHRSERRVDPPLEKKVGALRSDQISETKEIKKIKIEIQEEEEEDEEEESLGQHDLRHRLGKRRRSDSNGRRKNSGTERDNSRSRMEEKMKRSGITIRVDTTKSESPEPAEQEPVDQEPVVPVVEDEPATPEKPKVDEDDDLEIMRRRALESMARRKARFAHEQRAASRTSSTEDTEVKKILIPLNEDSSTDEEDDKEESIKNGETGTAPQNNSDSSSDSSDSSSSELSLSDEEEEQTTKDGEPQFIVTLEGINSDYFRSRHRNEKGKEEQGHVKPSEKTSPKVSKPDSKGDSVTPVQVTNKKPTPAKKVVPTPVKEPPCKPVPPPASKPVVLPNSRKKITPPARPEAKVAPLRKPIQAPPPTENKSDAPKKERKRITAPEPDPKPIVTPVVSRPLKPSVLVTPRPVTTSSERCKFWPKCSRGDQCFYFHPKPKMPYASMPNPDKYRWTSASALP